MGMVCGAEEDNSKWGLITKQPFSLVAGWVAGHRVLSQKKPWRNCDRAVFHLSVPLGWPRSFQFSAVRSLGKPGGGKQKVGGPNVVSRKLFSKQGLGVKPA